ncbi:MAG: hypothetical protein GX542_02515 [Rhodococcus sp.]|nr:hypothetical protein [Rhodococcus sp. (in: high G+C Gram-positive bacteria)]
MNSHIPRPGQHLPGPPSTIDPAEIHARVGELLDELAPVTEMAAGASAEVLSGNAQLLEQAHDVLVQALASVDKS